MELAIPLVALGGLYIASTQNSSNQQPREGFLPNVDIPDSNYPAEEQSSDLTSQLSTVNRLDGSHTTYTDKYFNPQSRNSLVGTSAMQNSVMFSSAVPNPSTTEYYSMTGEKVQGDYFQHANMSPYFGSKLRTAHNPANSYESLLDSYTGSGSQTLSKREQAPLFSPQRELQWANGSPNMSDFYQSRVNPSMRMANVNPFLEEKVAPGLGLGYNEQGSGGYNSGLNARDLYLPRTVDELRVANKPKAGEFELSGHEGPALGKITNRGIVGHVEKNRVDTAFELTPDRWMTTLASSGQAQMNRSTEQILHPSNRVETTTSYVGIATGNQAMPQDGEYMPSKHIDLGPVPITPAYHRGAGTVNDGDYSIQSQKVYNNNRSTTNADTYFGSFSGAIGSVVAPLLDALRPSRKENSIGNLRPYQNPASRISNSYIFNPADKPSPTIREMTEESKQHHFINSGQNGGGYLVADHQIMDNNRQTTQNFYYSGVGGAGERGRQPRPYDAEYAQTSNGLKSSTLVGYTPSGSMSLFNSDVNMTQKQREVRNQQDLVPTMPYQSPSAEWMGQKVSSTQASSLYSGIQTDRTNPDILAQFKGNPFVLSHLNAL